MMFKNNFIIRFFDKLYGKYIVGKEFNKIGIDELDRLYKIRQIDSLEYLNIYDLSINVYEYDEKSLSIEYYGSNKILDKKLIFDIQSSGYKKVNYWFANNITTICFDKAVN